MSSKKMQSNLDLYLAILQKYAVAPSFAITAKTLAKHPKLVDNIMKKDVEFAIHGYQHIDYTRLSDEQLSRHLQKAIKIFREKNIPFLGFRFPYLRYNNTGIDILGSLFCWDSSHTILWNILEKTEFNNRNWRKYQTLLNQYTCKNSDNSPSLPRFRSNILEIPVSLPDDDLLIDRLGIKDEKILFQIWSQILKMTYIRGELLVLQLHPERISLYKETLENLLKTARASELKIWLTSLNSVYEWWKEKEGFWADIQEKGNDEYEIDAHCSRRATILVKTEDSLEHNFFNNYKVINKNKFEIKSPKVPIIGIPKNCSPTLIQFFKNEGFIFEISEDENRYSVFLNDVEVFNEENEPKVLEEIKHTQLPLIRFWRWPNGCQSAFAITGDIDALTSMDFLPRLFRH
ncbi:MAG: polysaccharide deacetylase family protein [Candidatus Hodarchaeota archaeon]